MRTEQELKEKRIELIKSRPTLRGVELEKTNAEIEILNWAIDEKPYKVYENPTLYLIVLNEAIRLLAQGLESDQVYEMLTPDYFTAHGYEYHGPVWLTIRERSQVMTQALNEYSSWKRAQGYL